VGIFPKRAGDGVATLIIQPQGDKGDITINVTSPKLEVQGSYTVETVTKRFFRF